MFMIYAVDSCRSLLPVLQKLVKLGTPKQAKHAIRCIHALYENKDSIYQQIFEVSRHVTHLNICFKFLAFC